MTGYRYRVRVRGEKSLWGNSTVNHVFDAPAAMIIRLDDLAEPVQFGFERAQAGSRTTVASLSPGESYAVSLSGVKNVFARSEFDTTVYCTIVFLPPA